LKQCDYLQLESIDDPFQFRDDTLYLNESYLTFENQQLNFDGQSSDWTSLRTQLGAKALYAYYYQDYAELSLVATLPAELQLLSDHPFPYITFEGTIVSANPNGDVQIKTKDGNVNVAVGAEIEIPQHRLLACKEQHLYRFVNYGFIKDENVKFWSELP
jgi:hypothetical protein